MAKMSIWLLLLLLPTAVYVSWFVISQRRRLASERGEAPHWWDRAPWGFLVLMGVILVGSGLVWWAMTDGVPASEAGPVQR